MGILCPIFSKHSESHNRFLWLGQTSESMLWCNYLEYTLADLFMKVWNLTNCKLKTNHFGHNGYLNCVTVSPDGSLCASGGKDGQAMLWDLNEGKHLYTLDGTNEINALVFSPNRYWLCAATGPTIKIWVCKASDNFFCTAKFSNLFQSRIWRASLK